MRRPRAFPSPVALVALAAALLAPPACTSPATSLIAPAPEQTCVSTPYCLDFRQWSCPDGSSYFTDGTGQTIETPSCGSPADAAVDATPPGSPYAPDFVGTWSPVLGQSANTCGGTAAGTLQPMSSLPFQITQTGPSTLSLDGRWNIESPGATLGQITSHCQLSLQIAGTMATPAGTSITCNLLDDQGGYLAPIGFATFTIALAPAQAPLSSDDAGPDDSGASLDGAADGTSPGDAASEGGADAGDAGMDAGDGGPTRFALNFSAQGGYALTATESCSPSVSYQLVRNRDGGAQ